MMLGKYFKKTVFRKEHTADGVVPEAPQGILKKCNACKGAIFTEDVKRNLYICPKCGNYFRVHAYRRIEFLLDDGSFEEWDQGMTAGNPLGFPGYEEKVRALQERTGLTEAVVTGKGRINGMETVIGVCDGRFMMASMGEAVGEKITRAVERATELSLPVILFPYFQFLLPAPSRFLPQSLLSAVPSRFLPAQNSSSNRHRPMPYLPHASHASAESPPAPLSPLLLAESDPQTHAPPETPPAGTLSAVSVLLSAQ